MAFFKRLFGSGAPAAAAFSSSGPILLFADKRLTEILAALEQLRPTTALRGTIPDLASHVATLRPSLLVIVAELEPINGFSLLKSLKKDARLHGIPSIIFSTMATADAFATHAKLRERADEYVLGNEPADIRRAAADLLGAPISRRS